MTSTACTYNNTVYHLPRFGTKVGQIRGPAPNALKSDLKKVPALSNLGSNLPSLQQTVFPCDCHLQCRLHLLFGETPKYFLPWLEMETVTYSLTNIFVTNRDIAIDLTIHFLKFQGLWVWGFKNLLVCGRVSLFHDNFTHQCLIGPGLPDLVPKRVLKNQ